MLTRVASSSIPLQWSGDVTKCVVFLTGEFLFDGDPCPGLVRDQPERCEVVVFGRLGFNSDSLPRKLFKCQKLAFVGILDPGHSQVSLLLPCRRLGLYQYSRDLKVIVCQSNAGLQNQHHYRNMKEAKNRSHCQVLLCVKA